MKNSRVWINYGTKLYTDLITSLLRSHGQVEVVEFPANDPYTLAHIPCDVIIFSLDSSGKPDLKLLPRAMPDAKLVAFSPSGEYGMRRLPGKGEWEEIRPFGIAQLIQEVL